ncbi:MAG: CRISPR-associated endonuclease Cas3'', partial [Rhodoferax sp.]|nr:CRISPR-associated endonuclease Cas3'' [Rhodoferax sp.]
MPTNAPAQWAYLAGLWHDLGKYRPGFQRYLRASDNPDVHIEGKVGGREKTHSAAGALRAIETLGAQHGDRAKLAARVLACVIAGHDAGLDDWHQGLAQRLVSEDALAEFEEAKAAQPPDVVVGAHCPTCTDSSGINAGRGLHPASPTRVSSPARNDRPRRTGARPAGALCAGAPARRTRRTQSRSRHSP